MVARWCFIGKTLLSNAGAIQDGLFHEVLIKCIRLRFLDVRETS